MKFCKKCGAQLHDNATICGKCKAEQTGYNANQATQKPKKNKGLIVGIIAGIITIIAIIVIILAVLLKSNSDGKNSGVTDSKIKSAEIGDYIEFGEYEQDGDESNGKEDIEWLVLDKEEDRILVISKYALDCQPYNDVDEDITWEECTLREWLNDEFINNAFTAEEKSAIPTVTVKAGKNPSYDVDPGKDTRDKVFLLSADEAKKLFKENSERVCQATAYAVFNGVWDDPKGDFWWLRSPGATADYASCIGETGYIHALGHYASRDNLSVRPAMWIELG